MSYQRGFIIICGNQPLRHIDSEPYWLQFSRDAEVYPNRKAALKDYRKQLRAYDRAAKKENGIYAGVVEGWRKTLKIVPVRIRIDSDGRLR